MKKYKLKSNDITEYIFDENGIVIYDNKSEYTHFLNVSATFLFNILKEKDLSIDDIRDRFIKEYDIDDFEKFNTDLLIIICLFIDKNLVEVYEV